MPIAEKCRVRNMRALSHVSVDIRISSQQEIIEIDERAIHTSVLPSICAEYEAKAMLSLILDFVGCWSILMSLLSDWHVACQSRQHRRCGVSEIVGVGLDSI